MFRIRVECYAGHRGEEAPRRFYVGGSRIVVVDILDRWIGPDHRYFKLRGEDGGLYIVRHDTEADVWELTLYDSGIAREPISR